MRTCASSVPDTPGSRPRGGCSSTGSRSSCSKRATASAAASGRSRSPTARRSTAAARGSAPKHDAIFGLADEVGVDTYKTWVEGAHLLSTTAAPAATPASSRRSARSPSARSRSRSASSTGWRSRCPLDAPWTAKRAAEWDARSVGWWLERSGIRTEIARDLFEMAVRGLFTGDLNDVSFLHLLFLVRAHGSINTLFSIENGAQENMVDGGAGSIARARRRRRSATPVRLSAPVRTITQRDDHVVVDGRRGRRSPPATSSSPFRPRSRSTSRSIPSLPDDRLTLYRNAVAGPETKTLVVYDEPFWRADGFSGQTAEPRSAAEVTLDASPAVGKPGVIASFTFGPVAERLDALDPAERRQRGARRARRPPRPARGDPRRVHRDRVVERGVDARLLDGALPARHPHAATGRCCASRSAACTGPAPRRRRRRTARSTAPSAPGERAAAEILDRT